MNSGNTSTSLLKNRRLKFVLITISVLFLILILAINFVKHKIRSKLDQVPGLEYSALDISLLNATIQVDDLNYQPDSSVYKYQTKHVALDWFGQDLKVDSFRLVPLYRKDNWSQQFEYKKSRLDLRLPQLLASGVNFREALQSKKIKFEKLQLVGGQLEVFIDKNKPLCPDCYKAFPQEKLLKSASIIDIDLIEVKKSNIVVIIEKEDKGKVQFEEVYASIYNVTNDSLKIKENESVKADVITQFMGSTKMEVQFEFLLNSPSFVYRYDAQVAAMDLRKLNDIFTFKRAVNIKSGQMKSANINVRGDNHQASGEMEMVYEDFKIELMKKEKQRPKALVSGLINGLIMRSNNQKEEKDYQKGKIFYKRASNRSIFHQWAHAAQTGMQSILLPDFLLSEELKSN